jgi:hypothetical protein
MSKSYYGPYKLVFLIRSCRPIHLLAGAHAPVQIFEWSRKERRKHFYFIIIFQNGWMRTLEDSVSFWLQVHSKINSLFAKVKKVISKL